MASPSRPLPSGGGYDASARARRIDEAPKRAQFAADDRDPFARDRARVLHSSAFRRLADKTQVVDPGTRSDELSSLDFPRTRLTHSLEVAQIARELGHELGCAPDVVDAAGLAHDLGHPPFGHNGEAVLNQLSVRIGGFEGNAQTLRILTRLEPKIIGAGGHPGGLNLTRAVLDATCKYPWPRRADTSKFGVYADDLPAFAWLRDGVPDGRRCLEAQIMDWADDVAYSVHDVEDGVYAGAIRIDALDAGERAEVCALAATLYLSGLPDLSGWPAVPPATPSAALSSAPGGAPATAQSAPSSAAPSGASSGALSTAQSAASSGAVSTAQSAASSGALSKAQSAASSVAPSAMPPVVPVATVPAIPLDRALDRLLALPALMDLRGFDQSHTALTAAKRATSELTGRFAGAAAAATRAQAGPGPLTRYDADLVVPAEVVVECALLKALAARYVMQSEAAGERRAAQARLLRELVAALVDSGAAALSPALRPSWQDAADDNDRLRVVIDQVAQLTDSGAVATHRRLTRRPA